MFRRVVKVAQIAAFLAIGVPQPSAEAFGVPTPPSDDATLLVAERHRGGGGGGGRSERRGSESKGDHSERRGGDEWRRSFRKDERDGYGDCGWLRSRAVETGSGDWWRRYRECRGVKR
jgi:hypothetical protein